MNRFLERLPAYTEFGSVSDPLTLVLAPPIPRRKVLRIMILGFSLMVLLVTAAAWVGYQGSRSIRDNAQDLVREHLVDSRRAAALEASIEKESRDLLNALPWMLGACLLLAVAGSIATIYITNTAFRRMEWQSRELSQVSWHMVDSHEQIARRFSHEMHDELGQVLTGLRGMVKRLNAADIESRRGEMIELLDQVLRDVRELSQLLRPVILDDLGLDAGLRWLTERFTQRTQISVKYESSLQMRLPDPVETHLFRIVQEALTNIARHSGATGAWVRLQPRGSSVRLTIEDNGRGIPARLSNERRSLGMVGMRARARQINGDLSVENRSEGGVRIEVIAPIEPIHAIGQENSHTAR